MGLEPRRTVDELRELQALTGEAEEVDEAANQWFAERHVEVGVGIDAAWEHDVLVGPFRFPLTSRRP